MFVDSHSERSNFADVLGFVWVDVKVCQRDARLLVNYKMYQHFRDIETFDEGQNDEIMLEIVLRQLARIMQDKTLALSARQPISLIKLLFFLFCLFECCNVCEPWHLE